MRMKNYWLYGILGAALVFIVSAIFGFREMIVEAVNHIVKDFTVELAVHAYIAGLILIGYAVYLYKTRKSKRK